MNTIRQIKGNLFLMVSLLCVLQSCSSSKKSSGEGTTELTGSQLRSKYAALLGVTRDKIDNKKLYAFVDRWLHTSYSYGKQSSKGIDCSGFTQMLYDEVYKKKLPRTSEAQYEAINKKKYPAEGDLVFFTTVKGKKISHVGVYLHNNKFVNATNSGVTISDISQSYWKTRFVAIGNIE